jgi:hypothetical protein
MVRWDQAWAMLSRLPQPLGTTHGECQGKYDRGVSARGHVKGEREWLHLTVKMALTTWSC